MYRSISCIHLVTQKGKSAENVRNSVEFRRIYSEFRGIPRRPRGFRPCGSQNGNKGKIPCRILRKFSKSAILAVIPHGVRKEYMGDSKDLTTPLGVLHRTPLFLLLGDPKTPKTVPYSRTVSFLPFFLLISSLIYRTAT